MALPVVELYTTIKNPLGIARNYSYLPPHGHKLAAGATMTFHGDLMTRLAPYKRKRDAFERDLGAATPLIKLISTPAVILADITTGADKKLTLNTTLGVAAPAWG